jgi:hypothetical protein
MADITGKLINELTEQTTMSDSDYMIIGGADAKKITVKQIKKLLGVTNISDSILFGVSSSASVSSNSYTDVNVTFSTSFSKTPYVFATLSGSGDNAYRGSTNISIKTRSTTGFTARVYNASAASLTVSFMWFAII